jgi:hypothetical protein
LLWFLRTNVAFKFIQSLITGETSHLYAKDLVTSPIPKMLLKFDKAKEVERPTKDAVLLNRESRELLEQAKQEVENLIEKG